MKYLRPIGHLPSPLVQTSRWSLVIQFLFRRGGRSSFSSLRGWLNLFAFACLGIGVGTHLGLSKYLIGARKVLASFFSFLMGIGGRESYRRYNVSTTSPTTKSPILERPTDVEDVFVSCLPLLFFHQFHDHCKKRPVLCLPLLFEVASFGFGCFKVVSRWVTRYQKKRRRSSSRKPTR
jgi:hypothetical protein